MDKKQWTVPAMIPNPLVAPPAGSTLTGEQQQELARLEAIIRSGWQTFLEVGSALAKVRDDRLFADKYGTIEEYCLNELGFSRPYAYNLMNSAEVSKQLSSIEDIKIKPLNEAQCRELISVPSEKRPEAWRDVLKLADGKPLTAKFVHQAVAKYKTNGTGKPSRLATKPAANALDLKPAFKLLGDIGKLAVKNKPLLAKVAALRTYLKSLGGK